MKKFTRVIGLITSAVMLMSSAAYAAGTTEPAVTANVTASGELTLKIVYGSENNDKLVRIQIYEPGKGLEKLADNGNYTVTDSTKLNETLSYASQQKVENGKVEFTYTPKGKKGIYTAYFGIGGTDTKKTVEFNYKLPDEPAAIISDLRGNDPITMANVKDIFAKDTTPEVFTKYELLEIDTDEVTKDIYADFDALLTEAQKEKAYAYIASRVSAEASNAARFRNLFKKAAYITLVDELTGDNLLNVIDKNSEYSGIKSEKEYTDIRQETTVFSDAIKAAALAAISATDVSTKTVAEINTVIADELLEAAVLNCQASGTLVSLLDNFSAKIIGGNVAGLTGSTNKLDLAATLIGGQPYADMPAFVTALNDLVGAPGTPPTITPDDSTTDDYYQPSVPLGGGISTGGGISRPITNTGIYTDNNTVGGTPAATSFTDLAGYEWAEQAIKTLKEKNIINGKSATEFAPEDTVLREEFAKMIMLAVLPAGIGSETETGFADVDSSAWYAPFIAGAIDKGVISGYSETAFGLGDTIRREDMAVMCYRAIKAAGITLVAEREAHKFTDAISDYAQEAISSMYAAGLINGYSDTEFNGNGTATRAEAATILFNVVQKYGK